MFGGAVRRGNMLFKHKLASFACAVLAAGSGWAWGQDAPSATQAASQPGFYGGIVLRDGPRETSGVKLGHIDSAWGKFATPLTDDAAQRALVFGGYRWRNDLAVEGSFTSAESYALAPSGKRGVGLAINGPSESSSTRSWNADVYTSWSFRPAFALYGRLGYTQAESIALYAPGSYLTTDPRRAREGVNYGVGLRYDVTPALGLRVEYARFGRFAGETVNGFLPESDQVQFGMQFRF